MVIELKAELAAHAEADAVSDTQMSVKEAESLVAKINGSQKVLLDLLSEIDCLVKEETDW